MKEETETFPILQITEQDRNRIQDEVAREFSLTIFLNSQELVTLLCSPTNLEYLVVGFLFSEGLIKGKGDIKEIVVDDQRVLVRAETEEGKRRRVPSGGRKRTSLSGAPDSGGQMKVTSEIEISPQKVVAMMDEFVRCSELFRATGGVHSAALCDTEGILVFKEDIARHNAIDKIFGECTLRDIPTDDRIIITSGRTPSDIVLKVARGNIPILISKSAPTNLGVKLAADLDITLIGFVRGRRMNVYTHDWRLTAS
jgi:FdhD protein